MIIYRKSTKRDFLEIMSLLVAFCEETGADDLALNVLIGNIQSGKTETFVAENGSICGVVGYIKAGRTAIPDVFYVVPKKRNSSIGGRLYRIARKYAKKHGINKIVPIVSEEREPLYTKIGFKRKFVMLEKEI